MDKVLDEEQFPFPETTVKVERKELTGYEFLKDDHEFPKRGLDFDVGSYMMNKVVA